MGDIQAMKLIPVCYECGGEIVGKKSSAWFCSGACKQKNWREGKNGGGYLFITVRMAETFKEGIKGYAGGLASPPEGINFPRWKAILNGQTRKVSQYEAAQMLGHYPKEFAEMLGTEYWENEYSLDRRPWKN